MNTEDYPELEALKAIYGDKIEVSSESDDILLRISISVHRPLLESVAVHLFLPCKENPLIPSASSAMDPVDELKINFNGTLPDSHIPNFERSVSGRRWHAGFSVSALPLVSIEFRLSAAYPDEMPSISLRCEWLSECQKRKILDHFHKMFKENSGLPILSLWLDWLENDSFKDLSLADGLTFELKNEDELRDIASSLLQADLDHECVEFLKRPHECPICCDMIPGELCFRFRQCFHYFCRQCLEAYVHMHVQDGTVHYLSCPNEQCKQSIPLPVIREILSEEEFARWEGFMLQRALDVMEDIDWCPRCNNVVVKDKDYEKTQLGQCTECFFAFCTKCHEGWHQGTSCSSLEDQLSALSPEKKQELLDEKVAAKAEHARMMLLKKQEILSRLTVRQTTKPCPKCKAPIEKNWGCNVVHCTRCNGVLCWMCGKDIKDVTYGHFTNNTNCILFVDNEARPLLEALRPEAPENEAMNQIQMMLELNPELRRFLKQCPRCGRENLKQNQNNHLKCWACKAQYCYRCLGIFNSPKDHFGPTKCPQHSPD